MYFRAQGLQSAEKCLNVLEICIPSRRPEFKHLCQQLSSETILLFLSIRIRGYYDPNFHIPSTGLTLHLCSCEIVIESLYGRT